MAAPKLTAQQKRDREAMKLFSEAMDKQHAEHQRELAKWGNENFGLGYDQGQKQAAYEFSRLTVWQRIWFRP